MKNHIKSLLAASLLVGTLAADNVTNQTFMQPRPVGHDLAYQDSIWHRQLHRSKKRCEPCETEESCSYNPYVDRKFGAHFQFTGFYQQSTNKSGVGRYFGFNSNNNLTIGTAGTGVDIDNRNLIFNNAGATNTLAGTVHLKGKQHAAGVEIDYYQNLDCWFKGLYFLVWFPVANVKNKLELNVTDEVTQTINGTVYGIADYFNGNLFQAAGASQQAALTRALIRGDSSETGVGDVQLMIGYDFFRTKMHHVGINVGAVFPTGNEAHGKKLFQAIVGNGGHYAVGAGLTASTVPWVSECHNQSIEFYFDVRYRYVFKATDTRTLGIKGQNWGQYQFVGQSGVLGVMPAANILTRKVSVTPGNQVNAAALFCYSVCAFSIDLGYEVFAQEAEKVRVKNWTDGVYAFAGNNYNATAAFNLATDIAASTQSIAATAASVTNGATISKSDLDTRSARTPGFVTNKVFAALGYTWSGCFCPIMLKVGGYYEFGPTRKTLSKWSAFGGLGLNF